MTTQDDLAVIEAHVRERIIREVADSIRLQSGQLQLAQDQQLTGEWAPRAPVRAAIPRQAVTVMPVPIEAAGESTGWWHCHWPHVLIAAATATFLGLLTWGIVRIMSNLTTAAAHAVPSVLPIAVIILLALLLCGGRGGKGKTFSGTFSGRMH